MKNTRLIAGKFAILAAGIALIAGGASAQKNAVTVEQIVARVNNQIITLSDFQKADVQLQQEIKQQCQACPAAKIQADYAEQSKNLLRDLIDQQLLVERAKDMNISVETDLVKRLDDIRKQNNLDSIEALQKAVEGSGLAWEDYKTQLRNSLLTQEVIRREVGGKMDIGSEEVKKYYEDHKQDFNRPEQVDLAEIFLSTDNKTPDEIAAIKKKADDYRTRVMNGEDFAALAKRYSEGQTAANGGDLGTFERGQLAPQIEESVFGLAKGQMTDPIQTKTGFEILKVVDHYQAGLQPLDKVENEVTNRIYQEKMQPALRDYLAQLREENYVMVKPGYTDSAAIAGNQTPIQEVAPTPDTPDKKGKKKLPLPKVNS